MAVLAALLPDIALGDRAAQLIKILRTDRNYKVRLQAVIGLGKLKERRAVPDLIRIGLTDEAYAVRALTASSLGRIGDPRATQALKRLLATEKHPFVRTQVKSALAMLETRPGPAPISPGARFVIAIGKIVNKAGRGGDELGRALASALLKEFRRVAGAATAESTRQVVIADVRRRRMQAYVLDGAVLTATGRPTGGDVEVSVSIRVSLATFPENSMKAFYSGEAAMQVSSQEFKPATELGLFKEVIAGAAEGARKQIVSSYLSSQ